MPAKAGIQSALLGRPVHALFAREPGHGREERPGGSSAFVGVTVSFVALPIGLLFPRPHIGEDLPVRREELLAAGLALGPGIDDGLDALVPGLVLLGRQLQ